MIWCRHIDGVGCGVRQRDIASKSNERTNAGRRLSGSARLRTPGGGGAQEVTCGDGPHTDTRRTPRQDQLLVESCSPNTSLAFLEALLPPPRPPSGLLATKRRPTRVSRGEKKTQNTPSEAQEFTRADMRELCRGTTQTAARRTFLVTRGRIQFHRHACVWLHPPVNHHFLPHDSRWQAHRRKPPSWL